MPLVPTRTHMSAPASASTLRVSAAAPELTRQEKAFTLIGALLGMFLAALDQTVVATAGPAMMRDLQIAPSLYAWITTSYMVASTVLVPVYGKLSDVYGRKRILVVGIGLFLTGSLLCGLSGSTFQIILFRALQGAGSAALFTTAFAVIADIFPPAIRGRYTGIFGAVFGLSSVVGPFLGGFITDHLGWHWVFFINLPIGAVALSFIFTKMPRLRSDRGGGSGVDVLGAVTLVCGVVPLLLALSLGKSSNALGSVGFPWSSWQILGLFGLSAIGLAAFLWVERGRKDAILDLSLFRNRVFAVGNATVFVVGSGFLVSIVFLPLFMVNVVGLSATSSGLTTTPLVLGVVAGNILSGQIVTRLGRYKRLMLFSLALLIAGFAVMAFTLTSAATQREVTMKMVFIGLGLGPSIPLYTLAIQNAVSSERIGVATSTATFFRQMGSTVGVAVIGTVFAATLGTELKARVAEVAGEAPPGIQAQLAGGGTLGGEGEGAGNQVTFDEDSAKARVREQFARQRALLDEASKQGPSAVARLLEGPGWDPRLRSALETGGPSEVTRGLQRAEESALGAMDAVGQATREAFTSAIRRIFRIAILIAALGLLITLFLPDLPLRRSNRPEGAAAGH